MVSEIAIGMVSEIGRLFDGVFREDFQTLGYDPQDHSSPPKSIWSGLEGCPKKRSGLF